MLVKLAGQPNSRPKKPTPAKLRRMDELATPGGTLSILAVDHRSSLRELFDQRGAEPSDAAISDLKDDVCRILGPAVSAILLDSATAERCSADGTLPPGTALICPLESDTPAVSDGVRYASFDADFGPADARRLGAVAVKLLFHYRADIRESVDHHVGLVNEAAERCAAVAEELVLIIEPVPYRLDSEDAGEYESRRPELIVAMVETLAACDVGIFKVPFPGGPDAPAHCARIDRAVGARPWVLLGGARPVSEFARDLGVALTEGAYGFIVGRSIWADAVGMAPTERRAFLETRASEALAHITAQTASAGVSWRARLGCARTASRTTNYAT